MALSGRSAKKAPVQPKNNEGPKEPLTSKNDCDSVFPSFKERSSRHEAERDDGYAPLVHADVHVPFFACLRLLPDVMVLKA